MHGLEQRRCLPAAFDNVPAGSALFADFRTVFFMDVSAVA